MARIFSTQAMFEGGQSASPEASLGAELNTDLGLDSAVGWTGDGIAFTVTGGQAVGNDDTGNLTRTISTQTGTKTFRTVMVVSGGTFGAVRPRLSGTVAVPGTSRTAADTYTEDLIVIDAATIGLAAGVTGSGDMTVTSLSVREVISP